MFKFNNKIFYSISIVFIFVVISTKVLAKSRFEVYDKSLSTEQAAGQLMMIGVTGTSLSPQTTSHIEGIKPGSIILFKRNISSASGLKELTNSLQRMPFNPAPLFIGIDQEGGDVVRLQTDPPLPSAFSLSQSMNLSLIGSFSDRLSEYMHGAGINMNLAPVLDLADPQTNNFLGARSFGNNPSWVANVGYTFSKHHIMNFVLPVAKHFPGIGNTSIDPHSSSGSITSSIGELEKSSIVPFRKFAELGRFSGIMLSHFVYTHFDYKYPASLSSSATNYLRKELGFRGLIITDDLQMDAVKSNLSVEDAAVRSLNAGSDIVMVAYSSLMQKKVHRRIVSAIQSGELSSEKVQEKLDRIFFIKQILMRSPSTDTPKLLALKNFYDLDESLLTAKISKAKERAPASLPAGGVVCLASDHKDFSRSFIEHSQHKVARISFDDMRSAKAASQRVQSCSVVVISVYNKRTAQALRSTNSQILEKSVIVNLGVPALTKGFENYRVMQLDFPHWLAGKKIAQLIL